HEEGPEAAPMTDGTSDGIPPEEHRKELLGQILCLLWNVTPLAYEGIDRKPVGLTKRGERLLALSGCLVTGGEHDAPVGGLKMVVRVRIDWRIVPVHLRRLCVK